MRPSALVRAFVEDLLDQRDNLEWDLFDEFGIDRERAALEAEIAARRAVWRTILVEESRAESAARYAASRTAKVQAAETLDAYLESDKDLADLMAGRDSR